MDHNIIGEEALCADEAGSQKRTAMLKMLGNGKPASTRSLKRLASLQRLRQTLPMVIINKMTRRNRGRKEKMFRVIIAGSRTFNDYEKLKSSCDNLLKDKKEEVVVVSGGARGADYLGLRWATNNGHDFVLCPANWDEYGKSAGYRRNQEMAEQADALIAFWDGKSRGTKHMIDIANEKGLPVRIVKI